MRKIIGLTGVVAAMPLLALDGTTAEGGAPAATDNTFVFPIPNSNDGAGKEVNISVELDKIPPAVRLDMLKNAVRAYVNNSVNQENMRTAKANAAFDAYDAAQAADALQTAVAKPEGERKVADLLTTAAAARTRLYEGKVKKIGERKPAEKKDPVALAITQAVLRDVFEKNKAATTGYKWTDAVKEVGNDGRAYLEAKIKEKVLAGGDEAVLRKVLEEKYVKPAEIMYGVKVNKATETSLL
jgi:hypothetical protein